MKKVMSVILVIALAMALALPAMAAFTDVPETHWAAEYIRYAEENHLVNGMGDGTFAPDATLTQAQCCQILYNISGQMATAEVVPGRPWYYNAVSYIEGRTGLYVTPDATASREWLCVLFYSYEKDNARAKAPASTVPFTDCGGLSPNSLEAVKWCVSNGIINGYEDNTFRPNDGLTRAQGAKVFGILYRDLESKTFKETVDDAVAQMKICAESYGLTAKTIDWSSSSNEYWKGLQIQSLTSDSYYTLLAGGTDQVIWYTTDATGAFVITDETALRNWLKTYSESATIKDRTLAAVRGMKAQAEELGLNAQLKDWTNSDLAYFWQGLVITGVDSATYVAGGKNQVSWYKSSNGSMDKISEADILAWMRGQAEKMSQITPEQHMQKSIEAFMAAAKKAGHYAEYSIRDDKSWADVTLYNAAGAYSFIVGSSRNWYDSNLEPLTEEEVLAWAGRVGDEGEQLAKNIELIEKLFDDAGLIPVTNTNSQSRTARIGAYDYPSWNLSVSGREGGDLGAIRAEVNGIASKYTMEQKVRLAVKYFVEYGERYGYDIVSEGAAADTVREYWYGLTMRNNAREYSLSFGGSRDGGVVTYFRFVGDGVVQFTRQQLENELCNHAA